MSEIITPEKQKETTQKIRDLMKQKEQIDSQIGTLLSELPRQGCECNCEDSEEIRLIHEGEYDEIISQCINCGGDIINREMP